MVFKFLKTTKRRSTSRSPTPTTETKPKKSPKLKPVEEVPKNKKRSRSRSNSNDNERSISRNVSSSSKSKRTSSKTTTVDETKVNYTDEKQNKVEESTNNLKITSYDDLSESKTNSKTNPSQVSMHTTANPVKCPYLGTINRHLLDFDFEKVCSVSLSNVHVYACLVCGKYFQGRGKNTYCYTHALEECHYLFMNLEDCKVYCIPENYLVEDASLDDIKYFLKPVYTRKDAENLSTQVTYGKALDGTDFIPGCIGLNNLKNTDYFNVVIQLICVVAPLRDLFLVADISKVQPPDPVMTSLVQLIRKIFNTKNFKGIVSPHEFVQSVGVASNGVYKIGVQSDPVSLLSWLLTRIHQKLQNKNTKESVVTKTFGGELLIRTLRGGNNWDSERKPFRMLTLTVPEAPIFKDSSDSNAIPQVPIFELLSKYDGVTESNADGRVCKYRLSRLPKYLVLVIKRFTKNNFFLEKNPTIVSFPMKNLDLKDYVEDDIKEESTRYDLFCNVCHEGTPKGGSFRVHVYHPPSGNWFQMEDLVVTSILPQQVALTESYLQVYKRQDLESGAEEDVDMFS